MLMVLGACVHASEERLRTHDPFERINRVTFGFNQGVDKVLLKPTAKVYSTILPLPVRHSVTNVLANVRSPVVLVNELFQTKFKRATQTLARLIVNTTIGIGGIFDPATGLGLRASNEDFGQTLGHYGVRAGPYVVVPFLGPSSPRDGVGRIADLFLDPTTYLLSLELNASLTAADIVDSRSRSTKILDQLESTSLDYYATIRSAYQQRREYDIRDGQTDEFKDGGDLDLEGFEFGDEFTD